MVDESLRGSFIATHAVSGIEPDAIVNLFSKVQEIESVFLDDRNHAFLATIIVPVKDYSVENRIYDLQLELMDRFAGCLFDFDIVVRSGRKITDIVTPSGQLIFHRAT